MPADQTTNKAVMPANPSLVYLGTVTNGTPSPKPDLKKVKGAGNLDFIKIHEKTKKPHVSLSLTPVDPTYLWTVADDKYHHIVFRNERANKTVQVLGCKLIDLNGSVRSEDEIILNLELDGINMLTTAVVLGSGGYGASNSAYLDFSNVELRKDGSVVNDWVEIQFTLRNVVKHRFKPSDKSIRELARVGRDNSLTVVRDMDDTDALDELTDIINKTERAYKVKISNVAGNSFFSITYNNARVEDFDANLAEPEDLIGKRLPIIGTTITLANS